MIIFLLAIFIISIVLLIPTILLQTNGANNGMLSSNITAGAFGARSNEVLVKFTSYCVAAFILSALLLSIHFIRINTDFVETDVPAQSEMTETTADQITEEEASALPIKE